jgi:hypothetical protein
VQLQEAINVTSIGQLSGVLINQYNLSVILQQVSLQLPAGLSMITGLTVEEIMCITQLLRYMVLLPSDN